MPDSRNSQKPDKPAFRPKNQLLAFGVWNLAWANSNLASGERKPKADAVWHGQAGWQACSGKRPHSHAAFETGAYFHWHSADDRWIAWFPADFRLLDAASRSSRSI